MGGKSSQSTQQITIPPEVLARYNAVNQRAETVADRPFQQYSTDPNAFVAGLTPTQQAGIAGTNQYASTAQPYYQAGAGMTVAGAQAVNPTALDSTAINQYMSPYLQNVLGSTAALQNQMNQQAMSGQTGNAIRQGAFGGDRAGIAAANLAQQQQLANAKTFSDILNQGYGQALSTAQGQQQLGLGAAQANRQALQAMGAQLAGLGAGAQAAGLQGAQAQLAAGQAQQQTEQAGKTALYNQFLQQQSYPFQVAQFLANIAEGTGALSGSTTTTNQAMGGFSDARLKENIKPIGKTFDGQNIYSYNFKGSPQTQIGLMAQEVEKRHPEAVGLAGGYKTVRYDKATEDAADRGASMGGGVMPQHSGEGFADGGFTGFDPMLMQQIMQSYQQMYGGLEGEKGGLAAAGYVPQVSGSVPTSLQTAPGLAAQPSAFENMQGMVNLGTGISNLGKDVGLWNRKDKRNRFQKDFDDEFTPKAAGGLAGGRHGYDKGGSTDATDDNEIVVEGRKPVEAPAPQRPVESRNQAPAPSPITIKQSAAAPNLPGPKSGLDIPQIGNTVGLTPAAALTPLQDNTLSGIGSVLSGIGSLAAFSDHRLKENIKPIGKTFDGQTVYSYNYKGDPQTRMGLIAQEVEKHHPEAVGSAHGFKTVNYAKATGLAAHRGHFADGGETDDTQSTNGLNIPTQGNSVGLAGAPGLGTLQDNTLSGIGDVMSGIGSIAKAFKKKADGGLVGGAQFGPIPLPEEPDFSPEAMASGDDPFLKSMIRKSASDQGLAAAQSKQRPTASDDFIKAVTGLKPHIQIGSQDGQPSVGSGVRSVRNNNPGNIEDGAFAKSMPGYAGSDGRFAVFKDPGAGRAAQMALIQSYIHRGYDTPLEIASRWAPAGEKGNNPTAYAHSIAQRLGIGINDRVPTDAIPMIADAQTIVEGGHKALTHFGGSGYASGGLATSASAVSDDDLANASGLAAADFSERAGSDWDQLGADKEKFPADNTAAPENKDSTPIVAVGKAQPPAQAAPRQTIYGRGRQKPVQYLGGDVPEYGYDYMTEPFFKGLKSGSAQSWIPLLTGLGTFATTPTRSMLSGLLAGVGAGAQTYGNLASERNTELYRRQTAAAQQASVAKDLASRWFHPLPNGNYQYTDPRTNQMVEISPAEKAAMERSLLTGHMLYAPAAPEGSTPYDATKFTPKTGTPWTLNVPEDDKTPEGIVAKAMNKPMVRDAVNDMQQAKAEMSMAQQGMSNYNFSTEERNSFADQYNAAKEKYAVANQRFENVMSRTADVDLGVYGTTAKEIGGENIIALGERRRKVEEFEPIKRQIEALERSGYSGGVGANFWSRLASLAVTEGADPKLFGDATSAVQRQNIISALGGSLSGLDPNILSTANDGAALKAVVDTAIKPIISDAGARYDEARSAIRATSRPTPVGGATARAPAPTTAPQSGGVTAPQAAAPKIVPVSGGYAVSGGQSGATAALKDNRIPSGSMIWYNNPDGSRASVRKP